MKHIRIICDIAFEGDVDISYPEEYTPEAIFDIEHGDFGNPIHLMEATEENIAILKADYPDKASHL